MNTRADPNGGRITDSVGRHALAATHLLLILYAFIYYLSSLDPPLGLPTRHHEQPVGLRPALDRSRFISVRSIADAFLNDQVEQDRKISGDLFWFIKVSLLKGTHGLPCSIETQLTRLDVTTRAASAMMPQALAGLAVAGRVVRLRGQPAILSHLSRAGRPSLALALPVLGLKLSLGKM